MFLKAAVTEVNFKNLNNLVSLFSSLSKDLWVLVIGKPLRAQTQAGTAAYLQ